MKALSREVMRFEMTELAIRNKELNNSTRGKDAKKYKV